MIQTNPIKLLLFIIISIVTISCVENPEIISEQDTAIANEPINTLVKDTAVTVLVEEVKYVKYKVDFSEIDYYYRDKIFEYFLINKSNFDSNYVIVKESYFNQQLEDFIQIGIANKNISYYYPPTLVPRLSYWDFIVSKLPSWVDYPYSKIIRGYSPKPDEKGQYFSFLAYKVSRESNDIAAFFEQHKKTIYKIVSPSFYKLNKLQHTVDNLINVHDEIFSLDSVDNKMTAIISTVKELDSQKKYDYVIRYKTYSSIISDSLKFVRLSEKDILWLYSFWTRRYSEENDKVIYQILKEIKAHYKEKGISKMHWNHTKSDLFIPAKPDSSFMGFKRYLRNEYKVLNHTIIDSAYGGICSEDFIFENDIIYQYKCGVDGKGSSLKIIFPKTDMAHLRKLIELLYNEPDNQWTTPTSFEPEEMGCYYNIHNDDEDRTTIYLSCGC